MRVERCTNRAKRGTEWCGKHCSTQVRFAAPPLAPALAAPALAPAPPAPDRAPAPPPPLAASRHAARIICRAIFRWISRRAGPIAWCRERSNNPSDFYTYEPIETIPVTKLISFVDGCHGYCMELESARELLASTSDSNPDSNPMNPYTQRPLTKVCIARIQRHGTVAKKVCVQQRTYVDLCCIMGDLGYYTDPSWFTDSTTAQVRGIYLELCRIWQFYPGISDSLKAHVKLIPTVDILTAPEPTMRKELHTACESLLTSAERDDNQLGVMFIIGALTGVLRIVQSAYPDISDMFDRPRHRH